MRHLIIFGLCFTLGAIVVLIARAAFHQPYAAPAPMPTATPSPTPPPEPQPMATNVINTICPVCGMDVDPEFPAQAWKGKLVGMGCGACPSKFKAAADHYGPYAERNQKAPKP